MKYYIGVDPGKSGAVVVFGDDNNPRMYVMPTIGKEVNEASLGLILDFDKRNSFVVVEDVHAMFGASAKSTFTFGYICGLISGILSSKGIPFQKVQPKKWQKEMWEGIPEQRKPGKKDKNGKFRKGNIDTKAMSLLAAKRLFPHVDLRKTERCREPHDGIVDALLIAEYARRNF